MQVFKTLLAGVVLLASCVMANAKEAQDTRHRLDIPAQSMSSALNALAAQTGIQIVFNVEDTMPAEIAAPAIQGEYSPAEALERMLAESGLKYEFVNERTVRVAARTTARVGQGVLRLAGNGGSEADGEEVTRVAQGVANNSGEKLDEDLECSLAENEGRSSCQLQELDTKGIPEILITGSKFKSLNADIERTRDDAQPYVIIDRQAIGKSGATDISELLRDRLPMLSTPQTRDSGTNRSRFNLRGLGSDETLILVNGHRTASVGGTGSLGQPDLSGIPLSAIERVEVLPTTASGIYGGSATGGVINVVLKKNYSGLEGGFSYENTIESGGSNRQIDLSAGFPLEGGKTAVMVAGSYLENNSLLEKDRNLLAGGRAHILVNNPAAIFNATAPPPLGATTNILSTSGNLTLKNGSTPLNSPITFVPIDYQGIAADGGQGLIVNAGRYNLDLANTAQANGGGNADLVSPSDVKSLMATLTREFTSSFQAFVEVGVSKNYSYSAQNSANSTFTIPRTAPNNPFEQDIRVTTPAFGTDGEFVSSYRNQRIVGGVIAALPKGWKIEADYTWSQNRFSRSSPGGLSSAAANSAVRSGAIDVLRDTNTFPVDFSGVAVRSSIYEPTHSTMRNSTLRIAGPAWQLHAGNVSVSMLLEHREEFLEDQLYSSAQEHIFFPSRSQTVDGAYAEIRLPIVSRRNAFTGVQELELQLASRWEQYETQGANSITSRQPNPPARDPLIRAVNKFDSIDPTIGLRYVPIKDLMLRASFGTGFLPPAVDQLTSQVLGPFPGFFFSHLSDPRRGNEPLGALGNDIFFISGGNSNLRPEESESWSAGVVLTPKMLPGLRASVDWVRIDKSGNITQAARAQQSDFDHEQYLPDLIIRGPIPPDDSFGVGPVIGVSTGLFNISRQKIEACDVAVDYKWDTVNIGTFAASLVSTRLFRNDTQVAPVAPIEETAGLQNSLKWNANARLAWERNALTLAWTTRYYGSHWINPDRSISLSQGSAKIPVQVYHDFIGSYKFAGSSVRAFSLLANTEIQLGLKNIFGKKPPINTTSYPFYSIWGDPKLTSYRLSIYKEL